MMQEFSIKVDTWYMYEVLSSSFEFLHAEISFPRFKSLSDLGGLPWIL